MSTQTKTMTQELSQKISQLPIAKHFDSSSLQNPLQLKKGEKGIYNVLRLALLGAIGYFSWVYVLPQVFAAIGKVLAISATVASVVLLVLAAPAIFKLLKKWARGLHKFAINQDPFMELERQETKVVENQLAARSAHSQVKKLEGEMKIEADVNAKQADEYQKKILSLHAKAEKIRNDMNALSAKHGADAKGMDEYVELNAELIKVLSDSQRASAQLSQAQNFVTKYGSRAAIMKKVSHKLTLVEAMMDSKVLDFKATVEILKKDYEFASKARAATDAAKSAMLFDKSWELEYALDVVTSSIANDIAMTSSNFKDIESLTANFNMDSDEMFANLDALADDIQLGKNVTPDPKKYNSVDYKLTHNDKIQSGGFQDIF